jgi:hypothetical protein
MTVSRLVMNQKTPPTHHHRTNLRMVVNLQMEMSRVPVFHNVLVGMVCTFWRVTGLNLIGLKQPSVKMMLKQVRNIPWQIPYISGTIKSCWSPISRVN